MSRFAVLPCAGCGTPCRRAGRWATCRTCSGLVSDFLAREVGTRDPNAWIRANNRVMGHRRVFVAVLGLIRAERAALAGAA